ncbi:hypothetical protein F441_11533 [Phytophthora nicotianae CJ01A1]|uniref:Uncharacterized protein n=3 Tax=Phytophthora nicotianae TaxID=4792 RepID=W2WSD5_PHYNI|nr:hypothetical protein F441_11533 [Phytophthora nicotianae CJ01A1]
MSPHPAILVLDLSLPLALKSSSLPDLQWTSQFQASSSSTFSYLNTMSKLDRAVYDQSMTLDVSESVTLAEYFWIGGSGQDLRCKTKTLTKPIVGQNCSVF